MNMHVVYMHHDKSGYVTWRILVSLESRYGICCPLLRGSASALMTFPSELKLYEQSLITDHASIICKIVIIVHLLLIAAPSLRVFPCAPVDSTLSDPAKSTRFTLALSPPSPESSSPRCLMVSMKTLCDLSRKKVYVNYIYMAGPLFFP